MNPADWPATTGQHRATISDDFLARDMHAECSCGWVGEPVAGRKAEGRQQALAAYAAHVHVAAGTTVDACECYSCHDGRS